MTGKIVVGDTWIIGIEQIAVSRYTVNCVDLFRKETQFVSSFHVTDVCKRAVVIVFMVAMLANCQYVSLVLTVEVVADTRFCQSSLCAVISSCLSMSYCPC